MKAFYSDNFVLPLPSGHRFPMAKYGLLKERVQKELSNVTLLQAPRASDGELALVHTPAYVQAITLSSPEPGMMRDIGFPWSEEMVERSRRSAGATVAAARTALTEGLAANLAGGTHHAYADKGGGFCVFNDAAVAARLVQAEWRRTHARDLNVAVIDLDVHQGNGTAHIFRDDPSVFTLSVHGENNYPFRKEASDLDVGLQDGADDAAYLIAIDLALKRVEEIFSPGLVIYLAGADPHEGDRLGRLKLSHDGLMERDRRVFEWCWSRKVPLAFAMAGGYGVNILDTVQAHFNTCEMAVSYWRQWQNLTSHDG